MDMDLQNEGGRVLSLELAELVTDCRVFGSGGVRSYQEKEVG